jgi:tetratricopeptide (TPR) repeat protein
MSAGELFDLVRPAFIFVSILISTWIFASARKRFSFHEAVFWASVNLFLPVVVVPIYLAVLLLWHPPKKNFVKGRFVVPALYFTILLSILAIHEYVDARSVDAHLARASFAKVNSDSTNAIKHYRDALEIEDNPHTHKLLALSLSDAGLIEEAILEFRVAERGGEPDDAIHFYVADLLRKIGQKDEAAIEYQKFLKSKTCLEIDARCESARQLVDEATKASQLR